MEEETTGRLQLEVEKLRQEISNLQFANSRASRVIQSMAVVTAMLAVIGFGFGIWQSIRRGAEENEAKNREVTLQNSLLEKQNRMKFYERQLDIYLETADIAAKVAVETDVTRRSELYQKFEELSFGKLTVADYDSVLEREINKFRESFARDPGSLRDASHGISVAARERVRAFWDLR